MEASPYLRHMQMDEERRLGASVTASPSPVESLVRKLQRSSALCGEMEIPAYLCVSDKGTPSGESSPK